jgi:hypothetical protein
MDGSKTDDPGNIEVSGPQGSSETSNQQKPTNTISSRGKPPFAAHSRYTISVQWLLIAEADQASPVVHSLQWLGDESLCD